MSQPPREAGTIRYCHCPEKRLRVTQRSNDILNSSVAAVTGDRGRLRSQRTRSRPCQGCVGGRHDARCLLWVPEGVTLPRADVKGCGGFPFGPVWFEVSGTPRGKGPPVAWKYLGLSRMSGWSHHHLEPPVTVTAGHTHTRAHACTHMHVCTPTPGKSPQLAVIRVPLGVLWESLMQN